MSNRQDDALPVVAYLRATKAGEPVWDEDCVCQDPVYPADPDGSDADCISMPMVRLSDAQSAIASLQARLDAAEALLSETLQPGAYGVRSTLATRIQSFLGE